MEIFWVYLVYFKSITMKVYSCDSSFNQVTLVTSTNGSITSLSSTEKITYVLDESGEVNAISKSNKPFSLNLAFKVKALSCGREHVALLADDWAVFTWGNGESGALGLGSTESYSNPQNVALSSDIYVNSVVCGGWHTLILGGYSVGKNFILATGRNSEGQLGTGRLNRELFPVKIEIQEEIIDIKAGNNFSMILTESKSVFMTGDNRFGQLGIGHKRNIFTFERVPIDNVDKIACGNHSAAIANGRVYVWGTCSFGEFIRPTCMQGVTSPEQIFVGDSVGVTLDAERNLWNWGGRNSEGKIKKSELKAEIVSLSSGWYIFALLSPVEFYRKKERSNTSYFPPPTKNELLSPTMKKKKTFFYENTSETPKCNQNYRGFRESSSEKKSSFLENNEKSSLNKPENEKSVKPSQANPHKSSENQEENLELLKKISELQQILQSKDENLSKALEKTNQLESENKILKQENENLKDSHNNLATEHEKLLKNILSDSEIKQLNEKPLNDLEKEIENLKKENFYTQSLLIQLKEENNHLRLNQEAIEQKYFISQTDLKHAAEIRNQLEEKIISLQLRLTDLTTKNKNLYISQEKEICHKVDSVSLTQLSKDLEENNENSSNYNKNKNLDLRPNPELEGKNAKMVNDRFKQRFLNYKTLDDDIQTKSRKALSISQQERIMKVTAEKLKIEDLDHEIISLSSSSPAHVLPASARGHKKSFEDVRNTIMNLKKKRSFLHKEPKFSSSSFRK